MKKRIFASLSLVGTVITLVTALLTLSAFYQLFTAQAREQLRTEAELLSRAINQDEAGSETYLEALAGGVSDKSLRLTVVSPDGQVRFDSQSNPAAMENHLGREEIAGAFQTGFGEAVRQSDTVGKDTFYCAVRLADGSVLRVARNLDSITTVFLNVLPLMLLIVALLLAGGLLVSKWLTRRLIAPLNGAAAALLEGGAADENAAPPYEELEPFFQRIGEQRDEIRAHLRLLRKERDSFDQIIGQMKEGLVLIDAEKNILSVNPAALLMLGSREGDWRGQSLLSVSRNPVLNQAVEDAFHSLLDRDAPFRTRGGCEVSAAVHPAIQDGKLSGAVILLVDVTAQKRAEQVRREFSANVSHELKTPLTSINGFAEMIENGMASSEADVRKFAGFIHREAGRLIGLIGDIMRLSQIEELSPGAGAETRDLAAAVREAASRLGPMAREKDVALTVDADGPVMLRAMRRMMDELVANLAENAMKYNRPGGTVEILVRQEDGEAVLTVRDNGIGIGREHQERIFERFYRVDKSRSKQSGGTGLGLSIVKHIVEYHGGKISLESEPGAGTEITVRLPVGENNKKE